jgi:hypothetical protein
MGNGHRPLTCRCFLIHPPQGTALYKAHGRSDDGAHSWETHDCCEPTRRGDPTRRNL